MGPEQKDVHTHKSLTTRGAYFMERNTEGARSGEGPCSVSMPGKTRVSRGPVDAVHFKRSLPVLLSLLQHGQSRWESERRRLVLDGVTVILTFGHPR